MSDAAPPDQPQAPPRRRPWGWIAVCGVLAVAVVGLTIWALNTHSDLDQQRDATSQAQQEADQANQAVDDLSSEVDQIAQGGADAKQKLESAIADLKSKLSSLGDELQPPDATATAAPKTATP